MELGLALWMILGDPKLCAQVVKQKNLEASQAAFNSDRFQDALKLAKGIGPWPVPKQLSSFTVWTLSLFQLSSLSVGTVYLRPTDKQYLKMKIPVYL